MALPLKSGLDLYNNEALRMRLHNLGADPTSDFGVGQVYFNTSTSEGSGKRVRIYDGSAFRSLAYFDEIDNRLKLIEGSVDTSELINNLEDVQNFLADIKESDGNLMTMLNGKLDKDGGKAKNLAIVGSGTSYLAFESTDGTSYGSLGISSAHEAKFWDGTGAYTLLHAGNIGSQIVEGITTHIGDATNANGDIAKLNSYYSSKGFRISRFNGLNGLGTKNADGLIVNWPLDNSYGQQWYMDDESHTIQVRYVANAVWSAWKTIAFTDSNVASATKLETARTIWGQSFDGTGDVSGDLKFPVESKLYWAQKANYYIGVSYTLNNGAPNIDYAGYSGHIFRTKGDAIAMLINSSGNVTIGASDLAGDNWKLYINGNTYYNGVIATNNFVKLYGKSGLSVDAYLDNTAYAGLVVRSSSTPYMLIGNNVGIGTNNPTEKLHVVGNLYVTGNIIADGEVSAGGAGEEGGTGTGTGGGDALIYSQEFTPTTTSITITHNLSATKGVIVQVWEKNGNYWDMVLVDVEEVDTNTVTLFFGKTETTVHKVVIMG